MPPARARGLRVPIRQQDGSPLNVDGLPGVLRDPQTPATHSHATLEHGDDVHVRRYLPALRPQALVAHHAGVTRAFVRDRWQWGPLRVMQVLRRATLRG